MYGGCMEKLILELLLFLISYLLVYGIYYFFVIRRPEKLKKFQNSMEFNYLKRVGHVDLKKLDHVWLSKKVAASNAFIISIVAFFASVIPNSILALLISFLLLIPTILITYYILGKYLNDKVKQKTKKESV